MELPMPQLRSGPPWVMEDMIAAEPDLAESILALAAAGSSVAEAVRNALESAAHVVVVGCGTSEHAAMAVAALIADAARLSGLPGHRVMSRQAFEAALDPWPGGLTIGVSHEGETAATVRALEAAARAASTTMLITANGAGPAARAAGQTIVTPTLDRSWCHTVGYLSPLLVGGLVASQLRGESDAGASAGRRLLEDALGLLPTAQAVASRLRGTDHLVVCGSGADFGSARELALKVEEGVRLPAVARDVETQLHGHLVSAATGAGLIVIVADPREIERRAARAVGLLRAARRLGVTTGAIVAPSLGHAWAADALSVPAIVLPPAPGVEPLLAALAGSAIALQLVTVALIHEAGTNPDRIRREEAAYRESAALVEGSLVP